jgi:hypothetical protein
VFVVCSQCVYNIIQRLYVVQYYYYNLLPEQYSLFVLAKIGLLVCMVDLNTIL